MAQLETDTFPFYCVIKICHRNREAKAQKLRLIHHKFTHAHTYTNRHVVLDQK